MKKYNIVLKDNKNFVLASCPTLAIAKKRLEEIQETDRELQHYYNWGKLPEYEILENKEV